MMAALLRFLPASLQSRWSLDANELAFVQAVVKVIDQWPKGSGPSVLVQMPADHYILALFSVACARLQPSQIEGLWHQNIMSAPRGESWSTLRYLVRRVFNRMDLAKWHALYGAMGARTANTLEVGQLMAFNHWLQANKIWRDLQNKADLLTLELNGTPCGDLVYDTYLRYRVQPTADLQDPFLRTLIAQALNAQAAVRDLLRKKTFDVFLSSYSSYIQHGIPAREALRAGVQVYSAGNLSQFFKRLESSDTLHTVTHWRYRANFEKLAHPEDARRIARTMLEKRFGGSVDKATLYMKASAYGDSNDTMPEGVEGVVFLHDFFDSPHCYRTMLFADFLEWSHYTLGLIQEHQLPLAVKPHPNQRPESREVVANLQKQYPGVRWLPQTLSNRTIFASGIRCGVSVYGTILHELAYHGIAALAAGDHPHTDFRIATTPVSVDEYTQLLLNYRDLQLDPDVKNEVLAFYYMHNLYENEGLDLNLEGKSLREVGPYDSPGLALLMRRYPAFPHLDNSVQA
jgi:hypothetical protein